MDEHQPDLKAFVEQQADWERSGRHPAEGPLYQRVAIENLKHLEEQFFEGNQLSLMRAIYECAMHGLKMPDWVATGYIKGYQKIIDCKSKSFDDVFGKPYPKGVHLNALKKRRRLRIAIWSHGQKILAMDPDTAINRDFFKRIGKEIRQPVGYSEAESMWYEAKKMFLF